MALEAINKSDPVSRTETTLKGRSRHASAHSVYCIGESHEMGGPKTAVMKASGEVYAFLEAFKFLKPLFLISTNLIKKGEKNEGNEIYFFGYVAISTTIRLCR